VNRSRIGGFNDYADGTLIESLETALSFQILEVAAYCTVVLKRQGLIFGDQARGEQFLQPFLPNRPAFAFGKCLSQEGKI